jgi:hypothetical protein
MVWPIVMVGGLFAAACSSREEAPKCEGTGAPSPELPTLQTKDPPDVFLNGEKLPVRSTELKWREYSGICGPFRPSYRLPNSECEEGGTGFTEISAMGHFLNGDQPVAFCSDGSSHLLDPQTSASRPLSTARIDQLQVDLEEQLGEEVAFYYQFKQWDREFPPWSQNPPPIQVGPNTLWIPFISGTHGVGVTVLDLDSDKAEILWQEKLPAGARVVLIEPQVQGEKLLLHIQREVSYREPDGDILDQRAQTAHISLFDLPTQSFTGLVSVPERPRIDGATTSMEGVSLAGLEDTLEMEFSLPLYHDGVLWVFHYPFLKPYYHDALEAAGVRANQRGPVSLTRYRAATGEMLDEQMLPLTGPVYASVLAQGPAIEVVGLTEGFIDGELWAHGTPTLLLSDPATGAVSQTQTLGGPLRGDAFDHFDYEFDSSIPGVWFSEEGEKIFLGGSAFIYQGGSFQEAPGEGAPSFSIAPFRYDLSWNGASSTLNYDAVLSNFPNPFELNSAVAHGMARDFVWLDVAGKEASYFTMPITGACYYAKVEEGAMPGIPNEWSSCGMEMPLYPSAAILGRDIYIGYRDKVWKGSPR